MLLKAFMALVNGVGDFSVIMKKQIQYTIYNFESVSTYLIVSIK